MRSTYYYIHHTQIEDTNIENNNEFISINWEDIFSILNVCIQITIVCKQEYCCYLFKETGVY